MACTSDYTPPFQPQNPAYSGDKYGWYNCAAYAGAEGANYVTCGSVALTGAQVRALTNEPIPDPKSPGLTVIQVRDALARKNVPVTVFLKATWAQVTAWRAEGRGISLCIAYSVIRPTRYTGDPNFYGGHQVWYPPSGKTMDPLCDGRRTGIYKYHGEVYPDSLMRSAAGAFRIIRNGVTQPIGLGYAQGWYTAALPAPSTVPAPVPEVDIVTIKEKAEDWKPTANATPGVSNGVFRAQPTTSAPIINRVPLGTIVRSVTEVKTSATSDFDWRATLDATGNTVYMLRRDWTALVQGGDPAVQAEFITFAQRG